MQEFGVPAAAVRTERGHEECCDSRFLALSLSLLCTDLLALFLVLAPRKAAPMSDSCLGGSILVGAVSLPWHDCRWTPVSSLFGTCVGFASSVSLYINCVKASVSIVQMSYVEDQFKKAAR